jgi:uncharacterized repeat protein (TIGR04076 family)
MERYRVKVIVENLDGVCPLYKPGQTVCELNCWYFDKKKMMNLCGHALLSMMSALVPFSRGISAKEMGFGKEDDVAFVQCPDPGEPYTCGGTVVFRLERKKIAE